MPSPRPSQHTDSLNYRPDIDGLRAVAILAVVGFHGFYSDFKGGFIGVDIFFVISGFLISTIIFKQLDADSFSFIDFYSRRIRRIFPALILVLLFTFGVGWIVLLTDEYQQLGKHMTGGAAFISNFILWNESGYFDNAADTKPLLHLWSLGIEEQFYIFWPFILWCAWKSRFNLLALITILAAISFATNIYLVDTDPVADFYSPLTRFWELLAGSALAYTLLYKSQSIANTKTRLVDIINKKFFKNHPIFEPDYFNHILSVLGATLITVALLVIRKDKPFPGFLALMPVMGALFLIASGPNAYANRTLLSRRFMVWCGLISYPLYLWHWPIFSYIHIVELKENFKDYKVIVTLVSFGLAWLTYKFIETPIRFGTQKRLKTAALIFFMTLVGMTGYVTFEKNGLEFRRIAQLTVNFTAAKSDWASPTTKLVDGKIQADTLLEGQSDERVLFIGDSIMGQYFPRLPKLYGQDPLPFYTSHFIARNHCQPIPKYDLISYPEKIHCTEYYAAAMKLAEKPIYKKIVLAGSWVNLAPDNKLAEQGRLLIEDIKILRKLGKEVILIGAHPKHGVFAPNNLIKPLRRRAFSSIIDYSVARKPIEILRAKITHGLKVVASQSDATLINPFDYLCSDTECPVLIDGHAVSMDGDHIRARHAREHATFMDEIVLSK